ncbi:MAG: preprotein translocase subunit TatC [Nitrospiraceae bacterium]|nr:preprotein translocase subunit TatC [Nitrospiraceae bacterium]
MRRFLKETIVSFIGLTAILYFFSPHFLAFFQAHLHQRLAFFGVLEPILALLKLSSIGTLILLAPWILWCVSKALITIFGLSKRSALGFMIAALLLFYGGATFCFFVTLPFGINFLLGYQSPHLRPVIDMSKFVDFVGLFVLGFGLIFELPVFMTLLCRLRICSYETFGKYRRYAILIIAIMAAVLTPTPDVFNMAMMGIPLYILFEAGIIVAKLVSPPHLP